MSRVRFLGRHSLQTPSPRRRSVLRTGAVAALATVTLVASGVVLSGLQPAGPSAARSASLSLFQAADAATARETPTPGEPRTESLSRSAERVAGERLALARPVATGKLWTTAPLDLRVQPKEHTRTVGVIPDGKHIAVTGERQNGYAQVIVGLTVRWVTADYLSKKKIVDPAELPLSDAPCPDGSGIESGLQPQAVKVYRAVCAAFPELTSYGGQDGHGEHVNGQAIDFMVPSSSLGERIKDFLYAHHAELGLFDIIWSQHIWTIQRSGEGFRSMSDRGSATANHYDHVHTMIN